MIQICSFARYIVRIVGELVSAANPHRLADELLQRHQIVGMQLAGNHVIIRGQLDLRRLRQLPGFAPAMVDHEEAESGRQD